MNSTLDKNINPLLVKDHLLKVLSYLPHSKIVLNLTCINKYFNKIIKNDFKLFYNYTLKIDCGRRGSLMIGDQFKGFLDNKGRSTKNKSSEISINDKHRGILISTTNKPLKSEIVKKVLLYLSQTSINRLYIKRYQIRQKIPNSCLSTPADNDDHNSPASFQSNFTSPIRKSIKLGPIHEHGKLNKLHSNSATTTNTNNTNNTSLLRPSLTDTRSLNSDVLELSFPSHSPSASASARVSANFCSNMLSPNDDQFEELLATFSRTQFESLSIGEECVSWSWQTIMHVLQKFPLLKHLAVHIGLDKSTPDISNQKEWLNFIGSYFECVPSLTSLWCNDDSFLRLILSLSLHRSLGDKLTFIKDTSNDDDMVLSQINTNYNDDDDDDDINDDYTSITYASGHFITTNKNKKIQNKVLPLQYIRYQCQFAPHTDLTGTEFNGIKILEISPYESMFINVSSSIISLRIASGGRFYDEPDEYKIIIPYTNHLKQLCLYSLDNLSKIRGFTYLTKLSHLVIRKKPKNIDEFKKDIYKLAKYSPINTISLLFVKKIKDVYYNTLKTFNVKSIKIKMKLYRHPTIINVNHNYIVPPNCKNLDIQNHFTDYYYR